MSIKHLRSLLAVSEHRTFSAAADAICLTHAAVSQQMRMLEESLGVALFDRTTRTPTLNATGRALVVRAKQLVRDYDSLVPSILNEDFLSGEVSLGAVPTTFTGLVPVGISILKATYPDLRVRIRQGLTDRLITDVQRDLLDVAIATKPVLVPPDMTFLEIAQEPLRLIASQNTELRDPIQLLRQQHFIRFNRNAVVGTQIENWLQDRQISVSETMELDSLEAISSIVFANLGVSIVPESCVKPYHPLPLNWISLGGTAPSRILGLIFKSDSPKSDVMTEIYKALLDAIARNSEASEFHQPA